ncbi:hypothetical protein MTO96_013794 [Rhipicephalus appendiculatus]
MAEKNLVAKATKAASYNIVLQLTLRVLTFVLNAYILRHITERPAGKAVFCCYAGFFYLLLHAAIGALCLFVFLVAIYVEEKELIAFLKTCWHDGSFGKKSEKVQ